MIDTDHLKIVTDSAGVMNEVADGDGRAIIRHLGNVFADIVIQRELPFLRQQGNTHGHKLFRGGANVEHRAGRYRHIELQVGHTISLFINDFAVLNYGQSTTGRVFFIPTGKLGIDFIGFLIGADTG